MDIKLDDSSSKAKLQRLKDANLDHLNGSKVIDIKNILQSLVKFLTSLKSCHFKQLLKPQSP